MVFLCVLLLVSGLVLVSGAALPAAYLQLDCPYTFSLVSTISCVCMAALVQMT